MPIVSKIMSGLSNDHIVFRDEGWTSWPDWLGSDVLGPQDRKKLFWSFEKARAFDTSDTAATHQRLILKKSN